MVEKDVFNPTHGTAPRNYYGNLTVIGGNPWYYDFCRSADAVCDSSGAINGVPFSDDSCPDSFPDSDSYHIGDCPLSTWEATGHYEYSDEYTTLQLKTRGRALVDDPDHYFDADGWGYRFEPTAGFLLTPDELSLTIWQIKYKIAFKIPKVGRGECYRVTWVIRTQNYVYNDHGDAGPSTWDADGDPTYSDPLEWNEWDGVTPSGYDPLVSSTWPTSPEYSLAAPTSNSILTIGYFTDPEDPSTFVPGTAYGSGATAKCTGCE